MTRRLPSTPEKSFYNGSEPAMLTSLKRVGVLMNPATVQQTTKAGLPQSSWPHGKLGLVSLSRPPLMSASQRPFDSYTCHFTSTQHRAHRQICHVRANLATPRANVFKAIAAIGLPGKLLPPIAVGMLTRIFIVLPSRTTMLIFDTRPSCESSSPTRR